MSLDNAFALIEGHPATRPGDPAVGSNKYKVMQRSIPFLSLTRIVAKTPDPQECTTAAVEASSEVHMLESF